MKYLILILKKVLNLTARRYKKGPQVGYYFTRDGIEVYKP